MSFNDEKIPLKPFSAPSDREHKEIRSSLRWSIAPVFYLRIAFRILLYIAIHADLVAIAVCRKGFEFGAVVLPLTLVSFVLVAVRFAQKVHADDNDENFFNAIIKGILLPAVLDFAMLGLSLMFRTNAVYVIIYAVVAAFTLFLMVRRLLWIYSYEFFLSRALHSKKYEVMGAEVMRRRIDEQVYSHYPSYYFAIRLYYLETRADSGLDYTVDARRSTYRSAKEGTRGYLLSYHEGLNKDEDTPMMIFCKTKKSKE